MYVMTNCQHNNIRLSVGYQSTVGFFTAVPPTQFRLNTMTPNEQEISKKNTNHNVNQTALKVEAKRVDLAIILQFGLAAFIVCLSFYIAGRFGGLVSLNFTAPALSLLFTAISLSVEQKWVIRGIAVAGMIITVTSVVFNPPWIVPM